MAKLGLLYLNKGKWDQKQIISSLWIEKSLKTHSYPNKGRFNPINYILLMDMAISGGAVKLLGRPI